MPELPEDLRTTVRDQADARLNMDIRGYARYLTPDAIDALRASFPGIPPRVSRYELSLEDVRGTDHVVDVRYYMRHESFVVRSRWRKGDDGWMVVHAERLWADGDKRPGMLSRLIARATALFTGGR